MWLILDFWLGAITGSFLVVVAERLPLKKSILIPRSQCNQCHTSLRRRDMIPVLSQIWLRGYCRHCHHYFGFLSFFSELLSGLLFIFIHYHFGWHPKFLVIYLLILMAVVLSLTDILYLLVPPIIFYPTSIALVCLLFCPYSPLTFHPISALFLYLLFYLLNKLLPNSFGGGDQRLLTLWAWLLGYQAVLQILVIASSTALLWILLRKVTHRQAPPKIPFVPFLTLALIILLPYL